MSSKVGHHWDAVEHLAQLRSGLPVSVDFVSPIVSTMLACEGLNKAPLDVDFPGNTYAKNIGLEDAVNGRPPLYKATGLAGRTYSALAKLKEYADVDAATDTVAACLDHQFGGSFRATVNEICRIIGELHDNVASHARGSGFSALQVYEKRVEFAVADVGVGLLANVKTVSPAMLSHQAAIAWCFEKGNTTAASSHGGFEQRLPEDALYNPYPKAVPTRFTENNHLGEGLWQLLQLVGSLHGDLWVLTGDAELTCGSANPRGSYHKSALNWRGLAIEVILPVDRLFVAPPQGRDESVVRRFGI